MMPQCRASGHRFDPLLPEGKLSPARYQHITQCLSPADATPRASPCSVSVHFARYSSSAIFGTEHDSPPALRLCGGADRKHRVSPAIFPSSEQFTEWSDRFHGLHGAFTCTSVVADGMQRHAKKYFPVFCHPSCHWHGRSQPQPAWNGDSVVSLCKIDV